MEKITNIVWFKRDLRLHDHRPLSEAAKAGAVLPLYIVEPALWQLPDSSPRHWHFIYDSLLDIKRELNELGSDLIIRIGEAVPVLEQLYRELGHFALYSHEETGNGWTYARDLQVAAWCQSHNINWHEFPTNGVIRRLKTRDGWSTQREARMRAEIIPTPRQLISRRHLVSDVLPSKNHPLFGSQAIGLVQTGGRRSGLGVLKSLIKDPERISEILSDALFPKPLEKSVKKAVVESLNKTIKETRPIIIEPEAIAQDDVNLKQINFALVEAGLKQSNDRSQQEIYLKIILLTKEIIEKITKNFSYWNSQLEGGAAAGEDFRERRGDDLVVVGKVPLGIAQMNEIILSTPLRENKNSQSLFAVSEETVLQAATESHLSLLLELIKKAQDRIGILNRFRQDGSKAFYTCLSEMKPLIETVQLEIKTPTRYASETDRQKKLQESMNSVITLRIKLSDVGAPKISDPTDFRSVSYDKLRRV